jgi:uncharacterized membrane protein (DUF441 family)
MTNNKIIHISIAVLLIVFLTLLSDPFMLWMPMGAQMAVLLGSAVLGAVWSGFVMYERAPDERDAIHRMNAGRMAYLSGIVILTVALVTQGLAHDIDPWISVALGTMVLVKLFSRFYSERYQ